MRELQEAEESAARSAFGLVRAFERNGRALQLAITAGFVTRCRRARLWRSRSLHATIKNAAYGFDETRARSRGGRDGLFLLDRGFEPANPMMKKIFDGYLDKPGSGAADVAVALGVELETLQAVRLVSHHMRLLGVLCRHETEDWLVLVDLDTSS